MIIFITLIIAAGLFALDLLLPSGTGEWGFYLLPLLLTFRAQQRRYPFLFTGICSVMLVVGFLGSPTLLDWKLVAIDRLVGIGALWITATLLVQRKQAEQAVQDNERRLRAILDHSPVNIFTKDLAGRYTEFNRQCEITTRQTRQNVLGKTDQELFPKAISDPFMNSDREMLAAGHAITREMQVPLPDGLRTNLVAKFPLLDVDGKCTGVCGISADITELKRAEQALRQNQERLDLAQVAGRIGTFDWLVETGEVARSPALEALYGLPPGGFEKSYEAWAKAVHPDDLARVEAEVRQAVAEKSQLDHEFRIVWPDGSVHWLRSVARVFSDESGGSQRIIGVNIDITEPKRVHQELAFSLERLGLIARVTGAVIGAAPLSEHGRRLAEQVRQAFGVDGCVIRVLEGEELILLASAGIPEESLLPRLELGMGIARAVLTTRKPIFVSDAPMDATTASCVQLLPPEHRYISYAGAPLLAQDRVVGIMGIYSKRLLETFPETDLEHLQIIANHIAVVIANDRLFQEVQNQKDQLAEQISVRKRMEEALQTLSRRLLELQEAERRHIARELHDEIGQALTALKINMQAVLRTSEAAAFAPRLVDSISIVDRTLRQVRNLSLDLRPSMLDDLGLCAALRWYADQQAQRAGLRVQFVGGDLNGRLGSALETTCFRVAQEALTNIVRHARASSVVVQLETEADSLHLSVCDDGIGFDLASLNEQAERGASLGLLGMEERASLIGGRIELKSAPLKGTEVHAWFPIEIAPLPSQPETELITK